MPKVNQPVFLNFTAWSLLESKYGDKELHTKIRNVLVMCQNFFYGAKFASNSCSIYVVQHLFAEND